MVYEFLANGFEETEAVVPADLLRRAEVEVKTVGIGGKLVTGSHGIALVADLGEDEVGEQGIEMVVLPGGMPGTLNLEKSPVIQNVVNYVYEKGIWLAAICAAPSILGHKGMLKGKKAVCFPGYEGELEGAQIQSGLVCVDGNLITAKGPGAALDFGLELVSCLKGRRRADKIRESLQCRT